MHYIFEVTVRDGYTVDDYARGWVEVSEYIQRAPGARGTRLHRKIGDPTRALAIATWDSKEARDAMEADPPEAIRALIDAQLPHIEFKLIGEFEAPEWMVIPGTYDGEGLEHLDYVPEASS